MRGKFQDYLEKLKKDHRIRKRFLGGFLLLSVFVVAGVVCGFTQNGITLESDSVTYCGYEEHTHTSDCYEWVAQTDDDTDDSEDADESEDDMDESDDGEESTAVLTAFSEESSESTDGTDEDADESDDGEEGTAVLAAFSEESSESTDDTDEDADETDESGTSDDADADDDSSDDGDADEDADTDDDSDEDSDDPQEGDTYTDEDGVTYVYTLTCGYEEHTHTDTCYVDESSSSVSAITLATYGVSAASEEGEEEEEEIMLTALAASTTDEDAYYFADTTTLAYAAANQDESYIIYTQIGDDYYVVAADDTLVKCTYLGTVEDTTDTTTTLTATSKTFTDSTAEAGMYCWKDASGNLAFKYTALTASNSTAFANYSWTLSGTASDDTTGTGSYTIYNSENSVYISPHDVGVSETLSTGITGKDYEIDGEDVDTIVLSVTCTEAGKDATYESFFWVELYDVGTTYDLTNGNGSSYTYLTTTSVCSAWYWPQYNNGNTDYEMTAEPGDTIETTVGTAAMSVSAGSTYTVTISRSNNGSVK